MMSADIETWKRHDVGVKSGGDDDLESSLTVGEFDGTLTGLELADNEINNNSIGHWMSGKHKDSLIGSPVSVLAFPRGHHSPHPPPISSSSANSSSSPYSASIQQQQQQGLTYHQFPSPVLPGGGGQHHNIQPMPPSRGDSSNFCQSDWTSFITSINLGQLYDTQYQYILSAATTPCTKLNEETLTYLNQGQSYELKMKKMGDPVQMENELLLKSVVRVIFHERRLQYMEKEQLDIWKQTRPGERILDIDIPLSYGLLDVKIDPHQLSCIEFTWDPRRDSGVYIKVNAISTEFTPRRHGGEKGVPFRIQVETYSLQANERDSTQIIHCASCQVKVFKPKGADRKYKTDREKIDKKSDTEREKYQPAFECTVLTEIPLEQVKNYLDHLSCKPEQDSISMTSVTPQPPVTPVPLSSTSSRVNSFDTIGCIQPSVDYTPGSFRNVYSPPNAVSSFRESNFASNVSPMPQTLSTPMNVSTEVLLEKTSPTQSLNPSMNQSLNQSMNQSMNHSTSSSSSSSFSPKGLMQPIPESLLTSVNYSPAQHFNMPSIISRSPLTIAPTTGNSVNYSSFQVPLADRSISTGISQMSPEAKQLEEPPSDQIQSDSSAEFVARWLISQRFSNFIKIFQDFSGSDLLRLSREDLIEICGLADGIRLNNALRSKIIRPRLSIYVYQQNNIQSDLPLRGNVKRSSPRLTSSSSSSSSAISRVGFPTLTPPPSLSSLSSSPNCTGSPASTLNGSDSISSTLSPRPSITASPDSAHRTRHRPPPLTLPTKTKRPADYDYDYDYNDNENDNGRCNSSPNNNAKKVVRSVREICRSEGCFAVYLEYLTAAHLIDKLAALYRIESNQIYELHYEGPTGVRVLVTDSVVQNFTDHGKFGLEFQQDQEHCGLYHILLRYSSS